MLGWWSRLQFQYITVLALQVYTKNTKEGVLYCDYRHNGDAGSHEVQPGTISISSAHDHGEERPPNYYCYYTNITNTRVLHEKLSSM